MGVHEGRWKLIGRLPGVAPETYIVDEFREPFLPLVMTLDRQTLRPIRHRESTRGDEDLPTYVIRGHGAMEVVLFQACCGLPWS